ncbi:hypothetical protein MMC34_006087 [Xylographa carneopallida]|nr:hypothetical protein [Xylographa carneopallida]
MDIGDPHRESDDRDEASLEEKDSQRRQLPGDLPKSLDDRRPVHSYAGETEMYDAWQGQSQYINPMPTSPLAFKLSLDDNGYGDHQLGRTAEDNDNRLMEMLAAQAAHREDGSNAGDEDSVALDPKLSDEEKKMTLQKSLHMAASNGDVERVRRLVVGNPRKYVDVNVADEEGTAPLIYASCFGHQEVVSVLLEAGAQVDRQDRNQWTALMWAMTNRHKDIAKILLDHGASPEVRSSSGRTAFDFAAPNSEMSDYLHEQGYHIGDVGIGEDFYDTGFSQDRFEQEMEETEMRRRMMMESSRNLEVDLSSLGMDEHPETPDELENENQDFVWDKCLHDQMFVFQENELERILDIIITSMTPQRSPSQKPVPANILFLSARYAHYHASHDLLATLLISAMDKINTKVERHQWDMTVLAFWISNATLLLHYLKKDTGLVQATTEFQVQLVELINEIFILIIRDAERRMDKHLDAGILDHETIPGFEDVHFANEWNIFRSKNKVQPLEPLGVKPQAPNRKIQTSPRTITSLLSSTLFVLDLYDIHPTITSQILAQLFYWIGAELFNHILCNKAYLARTKAMQIRMNVSVLEDWVRANNRSPEHYENGSLTSSGENTMDAARKHFMPVIQLLQWLQCFSSLGDDTEALDNTLKQLTLLTPQQLLHSSTNYRWEVGEKGLSKIIRKRLLAMQSEGKRRRDNARKDRPKSLVLSNYTPPQTPKRMSEDEHVISSPLPIRSPNGLNVRDDEIMEAEYFLMDPAHMLQFTLPTSVDLRLSFGAGYGGLNRERERKYIPTIPPEFLAKLDLGSGVSFREKLEWDKSGIEA